MWPVFRKSEKQKMTKRTFYKTTITFEVLSEKPIPDDMNISEVMQAADGGPYITNLEETWERQRLNGKQAADALRQFGGDPSFFMLDDEGCDIDE